MDRKLVTVLLVMVAALMGYLLALHGNGMQSVQAQQGSGSRVLLRVGDAERGAGEVPITLVDTETQRLVVYEYNVRSTSLEMGGVRPFTYDVRSGPFNNRGVSVREVQAQVQRGGPFRR